MKIAKLSRKMAGIAALAVVVATPAMADILLQSQSFLVPLTFRNTSWTPPEYISVSKWSGWEPLSMVKYWMEGRIWGELRIENLSDTAPVNLTQFQILGTLKLQKPDFSLPDLVATFPVTPNHAQVLPVYDGTTDFDGPSGETYLELASQTASRSSSDPAELALYVGAGTISLPVSAAHNAIKLSEGGGPAAYDAASAQAGIVIEYYSYVPEPAVMLTNGMVLLGVAGLGGLHWRRRKLAKAKAA